MATDGLNSHFLCVPFRSGARIVARQKLVRQEGVLRAGQITLLPMGTPVRWTVEAPPEVDTVNISLDPSVLREMSGTNDAGLMEKPWFYDSPLQSLVALLAEESLLHPGTDTLFGEGLVIAIASRLVQCHSRTTFQQPALRRGRSEVRRVRDLLHADIATDHHLEQLAAHVGLSAFHLGRLFKAETGQTIHAYLLGLRLNRAKYLLRQTAKSVTEIANECGFYDQSHLTRYFRRAFGSSPLQARNE